MRVLDPPQPVKGSDGKYHLVYELVLTNSSPGTATVEWVKLTDFPAYGDPVLAVANGKVVDVVKGLPGAEPGVLDQDNTLQEAGGNHVILYIGGGRYAFYAHLKPGSMEVEEGDHVRSGQRIARLGNSGNTTAPHLHFHVMDAPLLLGADHNLPYVFDSFVY